VSVIAIYLKDPMRATAARLATSIPEQRYLNTRAAQRAPV
jgi:hypothetical protein